MSPKYDPTDIDRVREVADIVEVIGENVRLRRAGRSYKGLCPFHQEKTPSFTVDRDKGVYYCHGCGKGGSVFTFLSEVENLTFPEAVDALARRYGVELREVTGAKRGESPRARLIQLHEAAVEHYRKELAERNGERIRAYLQERGFEADVWERYRVGFGGVGRDGFVRTMLRAGFTGEELLGAGLATRDGRGMRDTFYGRVVFPIFDPSDKPIAFGARVLPDAYRPQGAPEGPKYLNSRETAVFHKSRILYGVNWARGDVARAKRLVIVEGYTDVIAMHQAGVTEAVATCGTSLTEQHMQEVSRRFGDVRVVLCLDADAAGQAAASRAGGEDLAGAYSPGETTRGGWLPVGRGWLPEVFVATLPAGQDPADFVRSSTTEEVAGVLDHASPLVEFLLRRAVSGEPADSPEGRARAVRKGADVLGQVGDALLRHEYALWLADRVGVEPYEVAREVERRGAGGAPAGRGVPSPPAADVRVTLNGPQRVEREALRVLALHPGLFAETPVPVAEEDFTLPLHRSLYRLLRGEADETGTVDAARLTDRLQDPELRRTVTELVMGDVPADEIGVEVLRRLREFARARHIEECKGQLRRLDPHRDAEAYDALFERLLQLERERRSLIEG